MREASTYRAARKALARETGADLQPWGGQPKVGMGKRLKWLQKHPKLAPYYTLALGMLQTSDRATFPTWRAIRKMMVVVATAPKIKHAILGRIPYMILKPRHMRPSWRTFPHVTIDANLKVAE